MSRRWETHCRPLVDNEILRKSRLHENEIYKRGFDTSNSSKIIETSSSSSVSSLYSILSVTTRILRLKLRKKILIIKTRVKNAKLVVFNPE